MELYAQGTILGVRPGRIDKESGEVKSQIIDVYDEQSGPGQLTAAVDLAIPDPGTYCTFRVAVRAYSGFVKFDGGVGDARVDFRCTEAIKATKPRAVKSA